MTEPVRIGDATLFIGDCLDVMAQFPRCFRVDAVITDPPYGVGLEYGCVEDTAENVSVRVVPAITAGLRIAKRAAITPGTRCMWAYPKPTEVGQVYFPAGAGFSRWGFTCSQPILYYGTDPHPVTKKRPNSYSCTEISEKNGHPCPKPDGWMRWLVDRASLLDETVLDPFMGSGTTGVACAQLGRKFIGIEIEPKYFDIACRRIEQAYAQGRLDLEDKPKPEQAAMVLA